MKNLARPFIFVVSAWMATLTAAAFAQDTGAQGTGNWETASTWTGGTVPNSSNNVYIGSTYPSGAASSPTVTLTEDESADNVSIGYGSPTDGTLDLNGNTLTITNTLTVGDFSGTGSIIEAGGSYTTANLDMYTSGTSLTFGSADATTSIDIENGATLTTATSGNIISGGSVANGSTLVLGANASLLSTGGLNVEGPGATLNLAGFNLSIGTLALGYYASSAVTLDRGSGTQGTFAVGNLYIGNDQILNLIAGDTVSGAGGSTNIYTGATLTTASVSNLTNGVNVVSGTLNLGANMSLGDNGVNVESTGSILNLAGFTLSANTLYLGYDSSSAVTLERGSTPGTLTLTNLWLGNDQNLTLTSADRITGSGGSVNIYTGATLTTAASANITTTVNVIDGTLNLGANMSLGSNYMAVEDSGATLNLAGHNLTATELSLGYIGLSPVTFERGTSTQGALSVGTLFIGYGQVLNLISTDRISTADVFGATLTTAATANITGAVDVGIADNGVHGAMNLGANLSLSGNLNVQDSGTVFNAQGFGVSAAILYLGWNGSAPVTVSNLGTVTAADLAMGNGTSVTLHGGDTISTEIDLQQSSVLDVQQSSGGTGLTLNGTALSDLTIDPSSMDLIFASTASGAWDFRWRDPNSTTNWISTLTGMINDEQIDLTLLPNQSYEVVVSSGYTYIEGVSVPEPSSLAPMVLGLAALCSARVWSRRQLSLFCRG